MNKLKHKYRQTSKDIFHNLLCKIQKKYTENLLYIITGKKYTNYHFTSKFSNYDSRHNENNLEKSLFFLFKWNMYRIENRIYLTNKFENYVLRLNVRKYKKWITLYSEVLITNAFHRGSTLII